MQPSTGDHYLCSAPNCTDHYNESAAAQEEDTEQEIPMQRHICSCGAAYWSADMPDDGRCNACFYASTPGTIYYIGPV